MTEGSRHVLGQPVRTGLLRRTSELARRVLSDLGREEGGSVVVTRDCPWVGPLLPSLPEPVLVVPTWDAFREHAALHSVDLLVYGSDVRRSAWQLPRARENEPYRVPCVVLYPFPGAPALLS